MTDPTRHDRDSATTPGSLQAEIDAARQERDAALRDLAAFTRMSAQQRARMEPAIQETAVLVAERDRAIRDLERVRSQPVVRVGLAVYVAARWVRRAVRSLAGRRRRPDPPVPDPDWRSTSRTFRAAFLDATEASGKSRGRPLHVAVVLTQMDPAFTVLDRSVAVGLARGLERLGSVVTTVEADHGTDLALEATVDVAVVVSAGLDRDRIPLDVISIAWVHDRAEVWLEDPRFDDHDLVIATDDALAAALEGRSAHSAQRVPGSAGDDEQAAFVGAALGRWARAPKVAIHIGPLTWEAAGSWGDTPFARAVQKEFGRRGWLASVHVHADRDSGPAQRADVALHVFGARAPSVHDGQMSLLWVISHPDRVSGAMCEPYDMVFAASDLFARQLAERIGPPVVSLHQATDPDRFHPDPNGPEHALLFVGNSRKVRRRILADLVGTPHDVAVYGGGWTAELLHPHRLRGEWIHNWELRRYYSSAGIVLCDHYDDMRDEGFISNRAYDALACGAFVISDRVPAIEDEFDGGLVTYGDADELAALVDHYLSHPDERRARAERGRAAVLAHHTFAHRVDLIIGEVTSRRADLAQLAGGPVAGTLRK